MDTVLSIVTALNALTPLGLAAGLGYIIYHMIAKNGNIRTISDNHLSDLPEIAEAMKDMAQILQRIEVAQGENFAYIKARLNGRGGA